MNMFYSFISSDIKSEAERDSRYTAKSNNRKTPDSVLHGRREVGLARSNSDSSKQLKGLRTRSSQLSPFDLSDNCDASVVRALQACISSFLIISTTCATFSRSF